MASVLDRATSGITKSDPYPYIVIDDALPQDVYDELAASFPDPEAMKQKYRDQSNKRFDLLSKWGVTEFPYDSAPEEWKAFTETHASTAFVRQVFDVFGDYTADKGDGPGVDVSKYGPGLAGRIGVDPVVDLGDVVPRVTVAVNTPVKEMSSVRGPHMDNIRKAFVGLLYFREPGDESDGGNLEIYKWKDPAKATPWAVKSELDEVELVDTVAYKPNRLVLFLATHDSLHGVSPRAVTPHWRKLVVISGWFPGVDAADTDTSHGWLSGLKARASAAARRVAGRTRAGVD